MTLKISSLASRLKNFRFSSFLRTSLRENLAFSLPSKVGKWVLGIASFLVSLELGLGMAGGYIAAKIVSAHRTGSKGLFPSWILSVGSHEVHLHHWLISMAILAGTIALRFFILSPGIFYGFLGGIAAQGILDYRDWDRIITKKGAI